MIQNNYPSTLHLVKPASETNNDAFVTDAEDFIHKPLDLEELLQGLKKISAIPAASTPKNLHFFVKVNSRLERIELKDIFHVEAMCDYVNLHTNKKKNTVHSTMNDMESMLPQADFTRVHRSHIVRMDCISEIENETLTIENKIIPISVTYKQHLKRRLTIL